MGKNKPTIKKDTADTLDAMNPSLTKEDAMSDPTKVSKPAETNGFVKAGEMKDETLPKNVTNVSKVAELVGDVSTSGSGTGASTAKAMRAISFSGTSDTISGDRSDSVNARKPYKSGDRPERKIDTALMHVDDTPAETYKVPVKTIPNIKSSDPIGYNGVYRNEHAISGKASGGSPKDGDFFRTVDLIEHDTFYFTHGQNNFLETDGLRQIKLGQYDVDNDTYVADKTIELGNYTHDALVIKFGTDASGRKIVNDIQFTTNDHTAVNTEDTIRLAGDAALRNEHIDELDRLAMVDKAGDENKDNWSPLPIAIKDASATNRMIKFMESIIGSYIGVSGDKLGKALSFQINKTAKDGVRKVGPMFEMCLGNVDSSSADPVTTRIRDWDNENANILTELFGKGNGAAGKVYNSKGSAALYVAYHDSLDKYNTKAKLLSLPLSFKTAYTSYKNNAGIFKMTDTLMKEYGRQEVFGKVDEDGTGITPVMMSDGVKIITPIKMSDFGTVTPGSISNQGVAQKCTLADMCVVHYEDLRNKYNYHVYNFLTAGLIDYFNRHANKICDFLPAAVNHIQTLTIPVVSTQHCLSLWDLVLCEALPDIVRHRKYAMEIVNEYEDKNGYPYSGLTAVTELVTPNVGFSDINSVLSTKNIPLSTAVRFLMPEVFSVIGDNASIDLPNGNNDYKFQIAKTILPWYFSQNQFEDTALNNDGTHGWISKFMEGSRMTFFDRRDGVTWNNVDRVLDMDPEQLKLAMDRMVIYPGYLNISNGNGNVITHKAYDTDWNSGHSQVYKHALHDDGIPVVDYIAYANNSAQANSCLTINDIIMTPRELGLSFVAPDGIITPTKVDYNNVEYQHYRNYADGYLSYSGPGFRAFLWAKILNADNAELADPQIDKTAGAAYSAHYHTVYSNPYDANTDIGLLFNANARDNNNNYILDVIDKPFAEITRNSNYNPTTGLYVSAEQKVTTASEANIGIVNLTKYLWMRLNVLPYIINPFDINTIAITYQRYTGKLWRGTYKYDPFEFVYLFNVCGTRCGEYSTSEYDRCEARIQRGLGYVQDPYIERRL